MGYKLPKPAETPHIKTVVLERMIIMEFLKEILGDELYAQVNEKITAYNEKNKDKQVKLANLAEGGYVSKDKFEANSTQLAEANKLIEQLKAGTKDSEALQGKITAYENQVTQLQEQLKQTQLEAAIKVALIGAKAIDVDYMTYKLKEKGDLELDEKGNIKGIEDKLAELKTQFPTQFESAKVKKVEEKKLPDNNDDRKSEPQNLADAIRMQYEGEDK